MVVSTENGRMAIGLPRVGPYSNIIRKTMSRIAGQHGVRVEVSPPTTKKTVNRGSQLMDENMCLPAKIVLGNILDLGI